VSRYFDNDLFIKAVKKIDLLIRNLIR